MYLLFPGRHQVLTQFQFDYIRSIAVNGLSNQIDVDAKKIGGEDKVEALIVAVTSANHSNTRRNPLPFYLRAMSIEAFGMELNIPTFIYGIDDIGNVENFASYTLKKIQHDSEQRFHLTPENTIVICSTPVMSMYENLGFRILPAELEDRRTWSYHSSLPWDLVEKIAITDRWDEDSNLQRELHHSSFSIWQKYHLGEKVQTLFKDHMISSDGDLTETRDYNVYVRQMDDIAELKYSETSSFIQPGRIGDIGCAVGSWLKLASADERFRESDLYGIEVSRHLYEICQQRKLNGDFANPFVFFAQKNAVTGLAFERASMNTIHTSSLTHEIESYGGRKELLSFIKNRLEELQPGGIWINRDVVAPYNKDEQVLMWLNNEDGESNSDDLASLSTYARFLRFANDFRKSENYKFQYSLIVKNNTTYVSLKRGDASEFLSRKDYTDNWESEMHETFCFWDFDEWKGALTDVGFRIHPDSKIMTNPWIVENRWKGKVELFSNDLNPEPYPPTTMFLMANKL